MNNEGERLVLQPDDNIYELSFNSMPIGLILQNSDGVIVAANPAAQKLLGLTSEQLQGRVLNAPLCQAIREDGTAFPDEEFPATVALRSAETVHDVVIGILNPNQHARIWLRISSTPQSNAPGAPPHMVMTTLEQINNRRNGETKPRSSQENLELTNDNFIAAFDLNPAALAITRQADGKFVRINAAYTRMLGYQPEDIVGRTTQDIHVYVNHADRNEILRRLEQDGQVSYLEIPFWSKDQEVHSLLVNVYPIIFNGEDCLISAMIDMTVQRQVEHELQITQQISEVLESISDAFYSLDEEGRFIYINRKAADVLGIQSAELIGKNIWEAFPSSIMSDSYKYIQQALRDRQPVQYETYSKYLNQWLEIHISPSKRGISVYFQDISERKRAEKEILQLTRLNITLSQINQTIVHAKTMDELFDNICWVTAKFGQFPLAWIGLYEPGSGIVTPVAVSVPNGEPPRFNDVIHIHQDPFQHSMIGVALRTGQTAIQLDMLSDVKMQFLHELANKYGYQSAASVPLRKDGQIIGLLNLTATESDFFQSEQELKFLEEIGLNISFALDKIAAADRLEAAHRQTSEILESISDAFYSLDREEHFTYVNRRTTELLNKQPHELVGRRLNDVFSDADQNEAFRCIRHALAEQRAGHLESYSVNLDQWVDIHIYPTEDGVSVYFQDITARKQAENALRESQQTLQLFVDYAPAAIAMFDRDIRYVAASQRYLSTYNLGEQNLIGRSHYELFPNLTERWKDIYRRCLAGAVEKMDEDLITRADGSLDWVRWEIRPWYRKPDEIGGVLFFSEVITEQKRAQDELIETREFLRKVFNIGPVAKVLTRISDRVIVDVSESFEKMFGYSRQEVVGRPSNDLDYWADPNERQRGQQGMATFLNQGYVRDVEFSYKTKSGAVGQAIMNADLIDQQGERYFLIEFLDISERKRAEKIIASLLERLDLATRAARMGVWDWDIDQNLLIWDEQMYALYGHEPGNLKSAYETWLNGIHPDDRAASDEISEQARRGEKEYDMEFRVIWPDGSIHWLKALGQVIRDEKGNAQRMLGVNYDITVSKQDHLALFESREDYRSLLGSLDIVVTKVDRDGRFLYANDVEAKYHQTTPEAIVGKYLWELYPADDARSKRSHIQQVIDSEKGMVEETATIFNNGMVRWFRASIQPVFNADGKAFQAVMTSTDITSIKEAQTVLEEHNQNLEKRVEERTMDLSRANAELMRANQAKDEFLSTMSHELRTPLNGILTLSESLQEGTYGELSPQQKNTLTTIRESGEHLLRLINDILDISKAESGRMELLLEPVVLQEIVEASLRLIRPQAMKKRLILSTSLDSSIDILLVDSRRLKQMLVNLLGNAVKFTPENGRIGVDIYRDNEGETIRFEVWDTGIGIPEDRIATLFQPFVQIDSRLSREYNGTGLGLALVSRLAELHGGSVGIESEEGRGSRFWFSIPLKQLIKQEENSPGGQDEVFNNSQPPLLINEPAPTSTAGALILIAEDNEINLDGYIQYLQTKGFRIITANNGYEAIERVEKFKPDLVLMDIQMPGMDGLEAIRRLGTNSALANLPIISLTALAMPGDKERCLEAGANAYLIKPVGLKQLAAEISNWISQTK